MNQFQLPIADPLHLDHEFCSQLGCKDTSSKFVLCKGSKCNRRIHLQCTGFPRGALKKDIDGSQLDLHWYCGSCRSMLDSVLKRVDEINVEVLNSLKTLSARLQSNTASLDNTASHVDDMTESMSGEFKEAIDDLKGLINNMHLPREMAKISDSLHLLTTRFDQHQSTMQFFIKDAVEKALASVTTRFDDALQNFTTQLYTFSSDLLSYNGQQELLKDMAAKLNVLSDNMDSFTPPPSILDTNDYLMTQPPAPQSILTELVKGTEYSIDPKSPLVERDPTTPQGGSSQIEDRIDAILAQPTDLVMPNFDFEGEAWLLRTEPAQHPKSKTMKGNKPHSKKTKTAKKDKTQNLNSVPGAFVRIHPKPAEARIIKQPLAARSGQWIISSKNDNGTTKPTESTGNLKNNKSSKKVIIPKKVPTPSVSARHASQNLRPATTMNSHIWLYVSGLDNKTTTDQVLNYTKKKLKTDDVDCSMLLKKGVPVRSRRQLSFKLRIPSSKSETVLTNSFWPSGVDIGAFRDQPKKAQNFHQKRQGLMRPLSQQQHSQQQKTQPSQLPNRVALRAARQPTSQY